MATKRQYELFLRFLPSPDDYTSFNLRCSRCGRRIEGMFAFKNIKVLDDYLDVVLCEDCLLEVELSDDDEE